MRNGCYGTGVLITGIITFIISWIYCIYEYGFLVGVGLGWIPSLIVSVIVGLLWPVIAIGIGLIILIIWYYH